MALCTLEAICLRVPSVVTVQMCWDRWTRTYICGSLVIHHQPICRMLYITLHNTHHHIHIIRFIMWRAVVPTTYNMVNLHDFLCTHMRLTQNLSVLLYLLYLELAVPYRILWAHREIRICVWLNKIKKKEEKEFVLLSHKCANKCHGLTISV